MRRLDRDNSGEITFEEFTEALSKGILNDMLTSDHKQTRKESRDFSSKILMAPVTFMQSLIALQNRPLELYISMFSFFKN